MLSFVVLLCLASSQVFGAAVLNNAQGISSDPHDYAGASAQKDVEYHESSSSKDSAYSYDKGQSKGVVDGEAVSAPYGSDYGVAPAAAAHLGGYLNGHKEYDFAYDRGFGYNHEEEASKDFAYSNSAASKGGDYAAASHYEGYAAPEYYNYAASPFLRGLHKRSVAYGYPAYGYGYNGYNGNHYGYPAYNGYYGNHYAAYPYATHSAHKRSVSYGYPAYGYGYNGYNGNHYGYPAYNGYYGNYYAAYPYAAHSAHKRSVSYGYPAYRYGYNGYYGNHYAYPGHKGYVHNWS